MTVDGLTNPVPPALVVVCCGCGCLTGAPVEVRYVERASGPGAALYACPDCVHRYSPGPQWGDELPTRLRRTAD